MTPDELEALSDTLSKVLKLYEILEDVHRSNFREVRRYTAIARRLIGKPLRCSTCRRLGAPPFMHRKPYPSGLVFLCCQCCAPIHHPKTGCSEFAAPLLGEDKMICNDCGAVSD